MGKRGVILALMLVVVLVPLAVAQSEPPGVTLARQCLDDLIDAREESALSLDEAVFGMLSVGADAKLISRLGDLGGDDCWPEGSCKVRDTALVGLAYDRVNLDTAPIGEWLLAQTDTSDDLSWFLQIDINNHAASECTLNYQGNTHSVSVLDDMTLSGAPGNCFDITSSGYWLKVKTSCLDETFQISCDQDFVTNMLYQKDGSSTIFISPNTHSAASSGTTEESVNSLCLKQGSQCSYEGTLWGALTLAKIGEDITPYLPYLLALAEDNVKYFPDSFLYKVAQGDDQYDAIIQSQIQGQYWQAPGSGYGKFYNTALALLALQGSSAQEVIDTYEYLLNVQTPAGCWNGDNLRDTAFLLYAGWPTSVPTVSGGGGETLICGVSVPGYCVEPGPACNSAGGTRVPVAACTSSLDICCTVPVEEPTCSDQGGVLCDSNEQCTGPVEPSSEGSCCTSVCEPIVTNTQDECTDFGGTCYLSCNPSLDEEQKDFECSDPGLVCCVVDTDPVDDGTINIVIIVLIALIVLLLILLLFRKRLRRLFQKKPPKSAGKMPPGGFGRDSPPPSFGAAPARMQSGMPRGTPPARRVPRNSRTDKELNDTLRKLKQISR